MSPWWSWGLSAIGIFGLYIAGRKLWWGWLVGIGVQIPWIIYAVVTDQPGFIASGLAYGLVYARNALDWYREHKARGEAEVVVT